MNGFNRKYFNDFRQGVGGGLRKPDIDLLKNIRMDFDKWQ